MCLAIPVEVVEIIDEQHAIANVGGIKKNIATHLVDELKVGDFVILHVGFALSKLNQNEAKKTLAMLQEVIGV
jgi:hydrogenase expression/formation protein HypC